MKITINEFELNNLIHKIITEMAYPTSFNMEQFKNIKSFTERVRYCKTHLQRIAEGSSRMVFKIDEQKVLKLAKNRKGLSQNKSEADMGYNEGYFDCIAEVFDYDDNYLFVEMELAKKCTPNDFKRITGYDFKTFAKFIESEKYGRLTREFEQDFIDEVYNEQAIMVQVSEFIRTYNMPVADLLTIKHYGVVNRNGEEVIVIIDYGLTEEVFSKHYSRKQNAW